MGSPEIQGHSVGSAQRGCGPLTIKTFPMPVAWVRGDTDDWEAETRPRISKKRVVRGSGYGTLGYQWMSR